MEVRIEKRRGELRTAKDADFCLEGYASRFNVLSKPLPEGFRERVLPGAFARSIREQADVKALFNHDPNQILGRVKNGTLKLAEDDTGLFWRAQLNPKSQAHRDLYAAVQRGDVTECSFAFLVNGAAGESWNADRTERCLRDVNLIDVSAVTYPAYTGTEVNARSLGQPVDADDLRRRERMAKLGAEIAVQTALDKLKEHRAAIRASKAARQSWFMEQWRDKEDMLMDLEQMLDSAEGGRYFDRFCPVDATPSKDGKRSGVVIARDLNADEEEWIEADFTMEPEEKAYQPSGVVGRAMQEKEVSSLRLLGYIRKHTPDDKYFMHSPTSHAAGYDAYHDWKSRKANRALAQRMESAAGFRRTI